MSRIGRMPIPIPDGVKIELNGNHVKVEGPLGTLEREIPAGVTIEQSENLLHLRRISDSKHHKSIHGLSRTLIANMIEGVTKGFEKELKIVGVGYKAEQKGSRSVFSLGYSHQIVLAVPEGITIEHKSPTELTVKGYHKELVGDIAAKIRSFRPPEPYKGKGIQYANEQIRRKAGKAAV